MYISAIFCSSLNIASGTFWIVHLCHDRMAQLEACHPFSKSRLLDGTSEDKSLDNYSIVRMTAHLSGTCISDRPDILSTRVVSNMLAFAKCVEQYFVVF